MVFLTGDTHGNFERIKTLPFQETDVLVILGDAGINYFGDSREQKTKKILSKLPFTLFCIHGNHEMRPETIDSYKLTMFNDGWAYCEPEFPNLIFAKDGEIYTFEDKKCIVLGGAYSVDKHYRLSKGWHWFENEQPSLEIKNYVRQQLETVDWQINYVFSHTCPYNFMPREMFLSEVDQSTVDHSTELWLDQIYKNLIFDKWYCGHYHCDKVDNLIRFLHTDVLMLQ
jgi:3-oxoacid CoA-transferase subunit A